MDSAKSHISANGCNQPWYKQTASDEANRHHGAITNRPRCNGPHSDNIAIVNSAKNSPTGKETINDQPKK